MVLPDGEHVETELIGELGLLEQLAHALLGRHTPGEIGKGGDSKFHSTIIATS